jgi:uncharacterized protein (TIGR02145 family)
MSVEVNWQSDATAGHVGNDQTTNNTSGFVALPGGVRDKSGPFGAIKTDCVFWSSTEYTVYSKFDIEVRTIKNDAGYFFLNYGNKSNGFSVCCVRD